MLRRDDSCMSVLIDAARGTLEKRATFVYLTATLDAATWGAELAMGDGPGRIYIVEPMGAIEDDPNLTDKKFPGNPTRSFRTRDPLRVLGEITDWVGHAPEQIQAMKEGLARRAAQGIEAIEDRTDLRRWWGYRRAPGRPQSTRYAVSLTDARAS